MNLCHYQAIFLYKQNLFAPWGPPYHVIIVKPRYLSFHFHGRTAPAGLTTGLQGFKVLSTCHVP